MKPKPLKKRVRSDSEKSRSRRNDYNRLEWGGGRIRWIIGGRLGRERRGLGVERLAFFRLIVEVVGKGSHG